ncbi:uncharacterized protein [Asterias amurensis]|uniref:uncharacterized protein n=1 Tax=Asterias amurensis TaxID=7602 RepID=UPI003AB55E08
MSLLQFVCVFLLVCGAWRAPAGVAAAKHGIEERNVEDKMIALTNKLIDTLANGQVDESVNMFDPEAIISFEGYPPAIGKEAIHEVGEILASKIGRVEKFYLDVAPLEEGAAFVYVLLGQKWYSHENELFHVSKELIIWRNTDDGYMVYRLMSNSNV